jgi:hypothetical protein
MAECAILRKLLFAPLKALAYTPVADLGFVHRKGGVRGKVKVWSAHNRGSEFSHEEHIRWKPAIRMHKIEPLLIMSDEDFADDSAVRCRCLKVGEHEQMLRYR